MRVGDRAAGIAAIAFGSAVAAYARAFPAASGQPVGPGVLPAAIGCALVVAGALLVKTGTPNISGKQPAEMLSVPVFRGAIVLAGVVFYALVLNRLGFLITATLLLSILFAAFGVRRARILPLAAVVTLAIHFAFYTLLRVPLPWGLLESIAW